MPVAEQLNNLWLIALAMLLGAVVGIERELAQKPAGLRTHMLVAGASALVVSLGSALLGHFIVPGVRENISSDPTRLVQAIITGISFLGAGTIVRQQSNETVEGLTTAASILFVAAIGISVGARQLILAIGVTILALITLKVVSYAEFAFARRRQRKNSDTDTPSPP